MEKYNHSNELPYVNEGSVGSFGFGSEGGTARRWEGRNWIEYTE